MAYSPAVVQRARARLAQAKADHEAETAARLEAAYEKFPELVQIDRQLRATMAQVVATSFRKGEDPAQAADLTAEHYVWLPYREVNRENFRSFQEE